MFSVVMPVWNKRDYLGPAVASVLAQTYAGFELIAVDDGSTDGGMAVVRSFGDPRIRIVEQANAGPGAARNRGIAAARHDWIAFIDADDLWLPDHLAELDRIRARHPGAGLIGTAFLHSGRSGAFDPPPERQRRIAGIDYFDTIGRGRVPFCASTAAIARTTHGLLGGFGTVPRSQDSEYWARIALALPVAASNRATGVYRHGTGGITDTLGRAGPGEGALALRDVGPSVALLADHYPGIGCGRTRRGVERYIDRRLSWSLRRAAKAGDLGRIRALRRLYRRSPGPGDRLIALLAGLPAPLAGGAYRLGFALKALGRGLAGLVWRAPVRAPGSAAGGRPGHAGG